MYNNYNSKIRFYVKVYSKNNSLSVYIYPATHILQIIHKNIFLNHEIYSMLHAQVSKYVHKNCRIEAQAYSKSLISLSVTKYKMRPHEKCVTKDKITPHKKCVKSSTKITQ